MQTLTIPNDQYRPEGYNTSVNPDYDPDDQSGQDMGIKGMWFKTNLGNYSYLDSVSSRNV